MVRTVRTKEDNDAIKQWLANGNKVTKCPTDERTDKEDIIYKFQRGRPKASKTDKDKTSVKSDD